MKYSVIRFIKKYKKYLKESYEIKKSRKYRGNRIFYFGVPNHTNVGDLAQYICIKKWMLEHFRNRYIVESFTDVVLDNRFSTLKIFKKEIRENDIIFFQSGYCTHDLGGREDEMHRTIITAFPNNCIVCLPQTVYFQDKNRKELSARIYNAHRKLLFVARDEKSFCYAKGMFPDIKILLYPDIVTTLIGHIKLVEKQREGVLICCRNDIEKFYSDLEISKMGDELTKSNIPFEIKDTTLNVKFEKIQSNLNECIMKMINDFEKYKVVITDRYHGTIFSIIAKTPVIVIRSNDHKVVTGLKWFKKWKNHGVYFADSLGDAVKLAKELYMQMDPEIVKQANFLEMYDKLFLEIKLWLQNNGVVEKDNE